MSLVIRRATVKDLKAITDIYNEAILTTDATFDTEPKTVAEQKMWFKEHGDRNPVFIAILDGTICGWASLSKWSSRNAYADTAEISVYVKQAYHRHGIGKRLLQDILDEGHKIGLHTIISRITNGNAISIQLHEQLDFKHVGIMKEVGKKSGRILDVCIMQKIYDSKS